MEEQRPAIRRIWLVEEVTLGSRVISRRRTPLGKNKLKRRFMRALRKAAWAHFIYDAAKPWEEHPSADQVLEDLKTLSNQCPACKGSGESPDCRYPAKYPCGICHGTGEKVTEFDIDLPKGPVII